MSKLFLIFICFLPFGSFLFRQVDLWNAQGHFVYVGILTLFCYSFFEKPRVVQEMNKPLGLFLFWAGLVTSYMWIKAFSVTQHYPVKIFFPFFNLLCLVLFYKLCVEYLNKKNIEDILNWLRYSFILVMFYCVLQVWKLDEFFKETGGGPDQLTGIMGNSSHLAGLLAVVSPLFFEKSLKNWLSLILLWLVIIVSNSASGLFIAVTLLIFWYFFKNRKIAISILSLSIISSTAIIILNKSFLSPDGRFQIWLSAFDKIKDKFITGYGLGSFGLMQFTIPPELSKWRHAHNEYLQILFELGFIGLLLILWCIWEYFKSFKDIKSNLSIKIASIFFGFCLLSFFNFSGHLWIISTIGMFSYACMYVIKNNSGTQYLGV